MDRPVRHIFGIFTGWAESAKQQGFKMLFDLREVYPEWPFETFVAKAAWLNKEKETVTKLLQAYHRGVRHTLENREDAIAVMKKWVKVESSVAAAGYDQYRQSFPLNGRIAEKGISVVIDQEFESGRIKKKLSVEDAIERSFMNLLAGP
jgi:ABC-type nitrate/sulfonate/bicarbonate transport system substrate-binding protein